MQPTLLLSILLQFSLIQLVVAATNETNAPSTNSSSIAKSDSEPEYLKEFSSIKNSKLTDFDSLPDQQPLCLRNCVRQVFLDTFKLYATECSFVETKGAKIDWRCICRKLGSKRSDSEPSQLGDVAELHKSVPSARGNTTAALEQYGEQMGERYDKCAREEIVKAGSTCHRSTNAEKVLEAVFGNFGIYCIERFGLDFNQTDREELEARVARSSGSKQFGVYGRIGIASLIFGGGITGFLALFL